MKVPIDKHNEQAVARDAQIHPDQIWPPNLGQSVYPHRCRFNVLSLDESNVNLLTVANISTFAIVFSSMSCPFCVAESPLLDELHQIYKARGILIMTVYTQEAHPGENLGQVFTLEDKLQRARDYQTYAKIRRPIFIDSPDGALHSLCFHQPNSCVVIDASGILTLRAAWTTSRVLQAHLDHILWVTSQRELNKDMRHFHVEWLKFAPFDADFYLAGLQSNGPQAVFEVGVRLIREANIATLKSP